MKKNNKVYSPYLTLYRPQLGNMLSILERITGIFLVIVSFFLISLIYLKSSCFLYYTFYKCFFLIFKGGFDFFFIDVLLIFCIVNFVYHIFFIPIILKRYRFFLGEINNYHTLDYQNIIKYTVFNSIILLILVITMYFFLT
jgi:succinate dehydrogenase/fumarate reductase cytochrome b subunit